MYFDSAIEALYQSQVILHSATVDNHAAELGPQEAAAAERMVDKRLREFSTGRFCAHKALTTLNPDYHAIEIPIGENREPLWPDGSIGSITHDRKIALAVVSHDPQCLSLGIDLQPFECLSDRVSERVASERELAAMLKIPDELASDGILQLPGLADSVPAQGPQSRETILQGLAACLIFSIKESIFKCYFPIHRVWIDFKEATLSESEIRPILEPVPEGRAQPSADDGSAPICAGSYSFTFKTSVFERMRDEGVLLTDDVKLPEPSDNSDGSELTASVFHGRFLITRDSVVSTAELVRSADL